MLYYQTVLLFIIDLVTLFLCVKMFMLLMIVSIVIINLLWCLLLGANLRVLS